MARSLADLEGSENYFHIGWDFSTTRTDETRPKRCDLCVQWGIFGRPEMMRTERKLEASQNPRNVSGPASINWGARSYRKPTTRLRPSGLSRKDTALLARLKHRARALEESPSRRSAERGTSGGEGTAGPSEGAQKSAPIEPDETFRKAFYGTVGSPL